MKHQIDLLSEDSTLNALWLIPKYLHLGGQGTTENESLHSQLSREKASNITRSTLESTKVLLGILILGYNDKYIQINFKFHRLHEKRKNIIQNSISNSLSEIPLFTEKLCYLDYNLPKSSTFQELEQLGFRAKNTSKEAWSKSEIKLLKNSLKDIANNKLKPTTACHYYYISHYVFQGSRSKDEVMLMVNQLLRSRLQEINSK